jgi:hypothetical protein
VSFVISVKIRCDHVDAELSAIRSQEMRCRQVITISQPENQSGMSATFAASLAEGQGWWARSSGKNTSTPKVAYCPEHRPDA